MLAVLGVFTIVTMWAVVVTEGCRKIKLQYYGFKLASAARYPFFAAVQTYKYTAQIHSILMLLSYSIISK